MLSAHLLLVCVAVAVAVPLPSGKPAPPATKAPPTKPPKLPFCEDLKVVSKQTQAGITRGSAAVSSTGSTQGSVNIKCIVKTPNSVTTINAAGNSGVSGTGVSAGDGLFKQLVKAITDVTNGKDGVQVNTGTKGTGVTAGTAGIGQNAGANGGVKVKSTVAALLKGGKNLAAIKKILQGTATSSSGHKGSGTGSSLLSIITEGGTKLIFDKNTLPTLPPTKPQPTTPAPTPKRPHVKKG